MRLLFVTNRYPPHLTGGYEVVTQLVADGLRKRGHEVDILTSVYGVKRKVVEENVYRLLHQSWDSPRPHRLAWWEVSDLLETRRLIKRRRPDCIWVWGGLGLFPSLLKEIARLEIPLIYDVHDVWLGGTLQFAREWAGFWQDSGRGPVNRFFKPLLKGALRLLHPSAFGAVSAEDLKLQLAVFVSEAERELNRSKGFVFDRSVVIYNGVDCLKYFPAREGSGGAPVRVLFVGRLVEGKGVHIALQALRQLTNERRKAIHLSIVGVVAPPIAYYESLKSFIVEHNLRAQVEFIEPVGNEAMPQLYNQYDILILPSHKEGFSMVILEAMACGLAVVATPVGGNAEILLDEENSLTFAVDDAGALARQLERLIDEPQLRSRLSGNAARLVKERFALEQMVEQRERFLHDVVSGRA
jgi:glycogen synthase